MAAVASHTNCKIRSFGGKLVKIHVSIHQLNRTVATLLIA